jgi:hypothetical protein
MAFVARKEGLPDQADQWARKAIANGRPAGAAEWAETFILPTPPGQTLEYEEPDQPSLQLKSNP